MPSLYHDRDLLAIVLLVPDVDVQDQSGDHVIGDDVRHCQGETQGRADWKKEAEKTCPISINSRQKLCNSEDSLGENELEVHVPETVLVELLYGGLQPPVRTHESDGDRDLGVHRPKGPVLHK